MSARRIGVLGAGSQTRKNAVALLKDFINNEPAEIFVVATPFDDSARFAADFGLQTGIPVTIITDGSKVDLSDYEDAKVVEKDDAVEALVKGLSKEPGSALLYCFEETEEEEALLKAFINAGVEVFDYADGLYQVTLEESADETAPEEPAAEPETAQEPPVVEDDGFVAEEPDEAQQKPARKSRAKAKPETEATTREAIATLPPPGDSAAERILTSPQIQELLELGRAVKTLLDYIRAT